MVIARRVVALAACALSVGACVDLIGVNDAYDACKDTPRCGAVVGGDGGTHDDGGAGDGGADASVDAGYGGPPCASGGTNRTLLCQQLGATQIKPGVANGSLIAVDDHLVAAWSELTADHSTLRVRRVDTDGTFSPLLDEVLDAGDRDMAYALAARADQWAVAFQNQRADDVLWCLSSATMDAGATEVAVFDGGLRSPAIAIKPDGRLAVAATLYDTDTTLFYGAGLGCPSALTRMDNGIKDYRVALTDAPDNRGADSPFRTLLTGKPNAGFDAPAMIFSAGNDDGGFVSQQKTIDDLPSDLGLATSSNGDELFTAFDKATGASSTGLVFSVVPSDLSAPPTDPIAVAQDPGYWWVGPCGPGCAAVATVPQDSQIGSVSFFVRQSGTYSYAGTFDAVCDLPSHGLGGASISQAWLDGTLYVLATSSTSIRLFSCETPPF